MLQFYGFFFFLNNSFVEGILCHFAVVYSFVYAILHFSVPIAKNKQKADNTVSLINLWSQLHPRSANWPQTTQEILLF